MYEYDEECLQTFILNQGQLFDEPVAETLEEAEAFLEDCRASIVDNIGEVREFLDQEGMDVSGMSDEEIEDASEVFALSDGRYLIVEGYKQKDESTCRVASYRPLSDVRKSRNYFVVPAFFNAVSMAWTISWEV